MIRFPAEWEPQAFVQLTWPDESTDWLNDMEAVVTCFKQIATAIINYQSLLIVSSDIGRTSALLCDLDQSKIKYVQHKINDTWARDHGGITVLQNDETIIYDFKFNGWGLKFPSNYDNQLTKHLFKQGVFSKALVSNQLDFVLEGGSIESNGAGTLMTTKACLLSKNRNEQFEQKAVTQKLMMLFGVKQVHWLENGFLEGDDTDSHIDTLVRFISEDVIMYVKCTDETDVHYSELDKMEKELQAFKQLSGEPYKLIALPMAAPIFGDEGERLPATYANFLFINGAVLIPIYGVDTDVEAIKIFKQTFPDKEIVPIDCSALIKQHGSLHCVTMQYPNGVQ